MFVFEYLKSPEIILFLVSSQKWDWTHALGTYCVVSMSPCCAYTYVIDIYMYSIKYHPYYRGRRNCVEK